MRDPTSVICEFAGFAENRYAGQVQLIGNTQGRLHWGHADSVKEIPDVQCRKCRIVRTVRMFRTDIKFKATNFFAESARLRDMRQLLAHLVAHCMNPSDVTDNCFFHFHVFLMFY